MSQPAFSSLAAMRCFGRAASRLAMIWALNPAACLGLWNMPGALAVLYAAEPPTRAERLRNWPEWRGPRGTGVAPQADPPLEWGEEPRKNIRWKSPLPGKGHSTPVVWEDRVFVTTAVPVGQELPPRHSKAPGAHDNVPVTRRHAFMVFALDRRDGSVLWQRTVREALPHEGGHYTGSLASNSAATDGQRLFAWFGSYGLYAFDFEGALQWSADFGLMQSLHGHGEGSSLALDDDLLFVNWDHEARSFLAALDKRTGRERWRVERPEPTSWSSPILAEHNGQAQLVVSGTNRVRGYDPSTGAVIWECGGLSSNVVASPVHDEGFIYAGSSYDTKALLAINLDGARGDITGTRHVAWSRSRGTPYVPSPLVYEGVLYYLNHYQGVVTRVEGKTGRDAPGPFRLPGITDVYASPVAAAGRIYVTDREGTTLVIAHAATPRPLAENRLEDRFNASAALAGRELFLRGERFLYCLAEE
jgi:outer membrane protein assembly factor BamB